MTEPKLDVYRDWLKIAAPNRPLNYYQILKLKPFEDHVATIRKHYRELNAHVRKFATGDYLEPSQALLNELAKAMLCLTDHERKSDYDFRLGRKTAETEGERTLETILLDNKILTPDQLKKAKSFADAVGIELQQAILQQKSAPAEEVMLAYAESIGLPFVNLDDIPVDEFYAPQMDPNTVRQHSFVPVMADMGKLILASPSPVSLDVEDELRMIFEMPVRSAICTPAQVNAAIGKYYPRDAVQRIASRDSMGTADAASAALSAAAGGASSSKTAAPKEKRVTREKKPLSAEAKKNRLKVTLVAFNFAFMATSFVKYFLPKIPPSLMGVLIPAIGAGLIVGGIAFFLSSREVADADHDAEK